MDMFQQGYSYMYIKNIKDAYKNIVKKPVHMILCSKYTVDDIFSLLMESPDCILVFIIKNMPELVAYTDGKVSIHICCKVKSTYILREILENSDINISHDSDLLYGFFYRDVSEVDEWYASRLRNLMGKILPPMYEVIDTYPYREGNYVIPIYSIPEPTDYSNKNIRLVVPKSGYGDIIKALPFIKKFVSIQENKENYVHMEYMNKKSLSILQHFLPTIRYSEYPLSSLDTPFSQKIAMSLQKSKEAQMVFNLNIVIALTGFEYCDPVEQMAKYLGVQYIHNDKSLPELSDLKTQRLIENIVEQKKHYKKLIGIQMFTNNDNTVHSNSINAQRSWTAEALQSFVNKCNKNNIGIVNLAPAANIHIACNIDVSYLKVTELFYIIKLLDFVVGIDSCCVHIAGYLQIPHITLFPKDADVLRSLTMDYSIISSAYVPSIDSSLVFERLLQGLNGHIKMDGNTITYEDTIKNKNIEWC